MKNKAHFIFAKVKSINEEERTIEALASTGDKDRDGDIILPSAFKKDLASFLANSVILACHQHQLDTGSSPVIGSAIPETIKITKEGLVFTMRFAETKLGNEYWILYRDKHMKAFSVGFIPIEWRDERDESGKTCRIYIRVELLEVSAVPVPSNRRALARAKGYFRDEEEKDSSDCITKAVADAVKFIIDEKLQAVRDDLADQLDEIKSLLIDTDSKRFASDLLGDPDEPNLSAGDNSKAEKLIESLKQVIIENKG